MPDETTDSGRGLSDNPVRNRERDWLGFGEYVAGLAKLLEGVETPFVLGVFGDWGVGKTSLMYLLREKMKDDGHATVWFNAWKYHGREDVWKALVRAVYCEVRGQLGFLKFGRAHVRDVLTKGGEFLGDKIGELLKVGPIVDEIEGLLKLDEIYENAFEDGLSGQIEQLLGGKQGKRLLVFIDDLDRCSPPAIVEVLEALKLYLDIERCVFVLGADEGVVSKVVEQKYGVHEGGETTDEGRDDEKDERKAKPKPLVEGRAYLQKIVQVPFHVPPMDEEQLGKFIAKLVKVAPEPGGVDAERWDQYLRRVAKATVNNPRQIKRFALTVKLLDSIAPNAVSFEQEGSVVERNFEPLKLAKVILVQFVAAAFYDTVKRLPAVLYYRQRGAIEAQQKDEAELEGPPGGMPEQRAPTADDLLEEILAEAPLWDSAQEATRYVTLSAGSVAAPIPGGPVEFAQVQKDLLSDDSSVRHAAATMVRDRGAEEVQRHVAPLLERLSEDEHEDGRGVAARALGWIAGEEAVRPIITRLTEDEDAEVRRAAAIALGSIGGEEAVQALSRALAEDEDTDVRWWAAESLGQIGGLEAAKAIREAPDRKPEGLMPALTMIASRLMERRREEKRDGETGPEAGGSERPGRVQRLTAQLLRDENWRRRAIAAENLGDIGGEEAVHALKAAQDTETDGSVQGNIGQALREIAEREGEDTGDETGPEGGGAEE